MPRYYSVEGGNLKYEGKNRGAVPDWSHKKSFIFLHVDRKPIYRKPICMCGFLLTYNPGHNILELYNALVQIRVTTSKTKLDT